MNPFIVVGFVGVFALLVKGGVELIKRQRRLPGLYQGPTPSLEEDFHSRRGR